MTTAIARDRNLEELKLKQIHLQTINETDDIYDDYATHVLGIETFKMTENQYRSALNGLPL